MIRDRIRLPRQRYLADLSFVERERTPRTIINKVSLLPPGIITFEYSYFVENLGKWSCVAVHNRVQKADLQPAAGDPPDRVAIDGKAIRIDDEQ